MSRRTDKPVSTGNVMSSRQIAYAATKGRAVTCRLLRGSNNGQVGVYTVTGYVVGLDDYHILLAVPGDGKISPTLVSKGRVDLIEIDPNQLLDDEPQNIKVAVTEMGRGFWHYCETTYFGKNEKEEKTS